MGNIGMSQITTVIAGWLVGMESDVAPILPQAVDWVDYAIVNGEVFGMDVNTHLRYLCQARALGRWMLDGRPHRTDWHEALEATEASWKSDGGAWSVTTVLKQGLDDAMAFALQSGSEFNGPERAIELYEYYAGKGGPIPPKRIEKPREFAYALALHEVGKSLYSREDLVDAGRRMISARLAEDWFGNGQYIRGATWLKMVYHLHDPALSPLEIILQAYANMPGMPRPEFLIGYPKVGAS